MDGQYIENVDKWIKFNDFIENVGVEVKYVDFKTHAAGLATPDCIYLSKYQTNNDFSIFLLLHEVAHYKSFNRKGSEYIENKIFETDFNEFFEFMLHEEKLADRYALIMFRKICGYDFPKHDTQQLDDPNRVAHLASVWKHMLSKIKFLREINGGSFFDILVKQYVDDGE